MKRGEEAMEILEAYDATRSLRGAAALAGCDHKTVAHWVRQRELAGGMVVTERCRPAGGARRRSGNLTEVAHDGSSPWFIQGLIPGSYRAHRAYPNKRRAGRAIRLVSTLYSYDAPREPKGSCDGGTNLIEIMGL